MSNGDATSKNFLGYFGACSISQNELTHCLDKLSFLVLLILLTFFSFENVEIVNWNFRISPWKFTVSVGF